MAIRLLLLLVPGLAVLAPAAALAQASASPYTNAIRYDAMGRVTGTIAADPDGEGALHHAAVRNIYDGAGRLLRVENGALASWQSEAIAPASWTGFIVFRTLETAYDMMGRKTRELVREGAAGAVRGVTQHSYDAAGRPECSAVRMNPAVFGSLPASACTAGATGAQGPDRIARTLYDAAGQRLQLRAGVGTADEGTEASWAYNLNGQVVAVIDGNGNRAESRYDGHGRQDRWTFPSAARAAAFNDATPASALASAGSVNANDYEEYAYDANGNRTSLRKRDGSVLTYAYDNLNRMTVKAVPSRAGLTAAQTRDVYYGYDLRNLHLSARFDSQAGEGITNAYDGFGRLASTSIDMGGVTRTLGYVYDANGNRIRITHPDGTYFVTWHDGLSRPFYIQANGLGGLAYNFYTAHGAPAYTGRPGTAAVHSYDEVQRPIARTLLFLGGTGNAAWSYGLNPAGQIGSVSRDNDAYAWTGHYAVNRAYTTNGLSQYSAAGSATFGYDPNGNLTSDGGRTYLYDVENRMVSTSAGAALIYDPLGRLFQLTASGGAVTRFLYDGDALVAEYDGTNAMTRRHVHWPGADLPMTTYEGAGLGTPRQLFTDHQGSVVAFADGNGTILGINSYDEYGIPGAGNAGRFQYTGQIWLPELGMYHYKARIYSPYLGRFMQTDPVGYEDQYNLYAYVGNDPINATDPDGRQVVVTILGYPLGRAGGYGHAYVAYRDVRTGEQRISRAGPQPAYEGGSVAAITNSPVGRSQLTAVDTPLAESIDRPAKNPDTVMLDTAIVPGNIAGVRQQVETFNQRVNEADVPYQPQAPNSNTYAGDAFEMLTGRGPREETPLSFPGLRDNVFRPPVPCLPLKDTSSCPPR